jgi:hypothetical protein
MKGRVKHVQIGGKRFLTLNLDGSLVPWNKFPWKDLEQNEGQFDNLIKTLTELKLTVSIGVSNNYLLVGLGSSTEAVARLAGEGEKLGGRPELKPLARFADRKLTSIDYLSKALRSRTATKPEDLDNALNALKQGLALAPLEDKEKKKILKDAAEILGDIKKSLPQFGASLSFSFLTETGSEGYSYDYGNHKAPKNPRPLTLLNHLGGSPILAVVGRSPGDESGYPTLAKWARLVYENLDGIASDKLPGDVKEKYQQVRDAFLPLFKRFDTVTTKMLLPALADGQGGLVLDAKWTSKQWVKVLGETHKPLPMLEIGVLLGLSDAALFVKAMSEYGRLIEDTVGVLREQVPGANIPELKLPAPKVVKKAGATLYTYPLPEEAGLDPQVMPTAAVGEKVFAFTFSQAFAERLLADKPLQVKGTALADRDRPLVAAVVFNWAGLVDAATPWLEMAVTHAPRAVDIEGNPIAGEELWKQMRTVLEVLKVFKGVTTATHIEDGVSVTHSVSVVRDLPR